MKTEFAIWMVSFLLQRKAATKETILQEWSRHRNEACSIHRNTFGNYRKKAESLFDTNIEYNPRTQEYFLEHPEQVTQNSMFKWLLQSYTASNAITRRSKLKDRIMLDTTSGGEELIDTVTEAMEKGRCIHLVYQPFWDDPKERCVEPYFIKLFKHRWYLIARKPDEGVFRTYCFDRIKSVRLTEQRFRFRNDADAKTMFRDYYGIIQMPVPKEHIVLKVTCEQGIYLHTRKLHPSQRLIHQDNDYMIFELYLKPCYDFVQELLSCGSSLEVLSPESLRKEMEETAEDLFHIYNPQTNEPQSQLKSPQKDGE